MKVAGSSPLHHLGVARTPPHLGVKVRPTLKTFNFRGGTAIPLRVSTPEKLGDGPATSWEFLG